MRLALLGLAASLSALPLVAQDLRVSQSRVTLAATFSRAGEEKAPVDRPYDSDVNVRTPLDRVRYGNSQILRTFLAAQEPAITSIRGWSLVAIWADWPDSGNSYKFFARKKGLEPLEIPASFLNLDLTDPYVGKSVTLREGVAVSGTESHKSLATVALGAIAVTDGDSNDDDPRATASGTANGVLFGSGNYLRPAGASAAIYRPVNERFLGYGTAGEDVLSLSLRIGASSSIPASLFPAESRPTAPSSGPDASVENSEQITGGTLVIGTGPTGPGGTLGSDVTLSDGGPNTGGTLPLGAAM